MICLYWKAKHLDGVKYLVIVATTGLSKQELTGKQKAKLNSGALKLGIMRRVGSSHNTTFYGAVPKR
jgi:hypothetical protein